MNIQKQNTTKELELIVELSADEMKPYVTQACQKISQETKVGGFRPGHVPYEILKQKVSEIYIMEEAANIAIQKTAGDIIKKNIEKEEVVGRPEVRLTKVAADNPLEFKIILALTPEIKLGKYKELNIKQDGAQIKDENVEKVLKDLQVMRAKEVITEREIKDGDKALVGIQMFLDNVPIEGGQTQNAAVIIGADYIIPGFDKNLIGAKKGDAREFKLPYPKEHYQKNLAGKMVEFKVEIKEVYERELPELNDEFAKNLGGKSLAEVKKQIQDNLEQEAKQKVEQKAMLEIFDKLLASTTFSHLPEQLVHSEAHSMIHELEHNVEDQGGKFADYLTHIKKSEEDLEKDFMPEAEKRLKISFIIAEIVKAEKLEITEEELKKEINEQLKIYEEKPEMKKQAESEEFKHYVRYNMLNQKVMEKLKEWNLV
ncbi:trigger factor [Candidatus Falkowbacteria bacterium CG10_big_fil_rev_8_21_14_0_10_43_11]|uniref:Trigger factor n=1 Tax=Candidatus Falkowbacteria bacterium CG10_big_fil_rev_8_21_14_0_10_43_11 TaxID=1974568 RepID=A0A2M6WMI5_9BACT|nr:MAG: trigger factor [Candidatus Falkowbacteria bacterium CG10_big_fil_rev_8_21_14_0_10_43_11]